jgi:hypothetical protein
MAIFWATPLAHVWVELIGCIPAREGMPEPQLGEQIVKSRWILVLGVFLVVGACADETVIEETREWYKPWYVTATGEGQGQSP